MTRQTKRVILNKEKLFNEAMKPVQVSTFNEIRSLVETLLGNTESNKIELSTNLSWAEEGQKQVAKVTGESSDVSLYSMLLEGFEIIKKQVEANNTIQEQITQFQNEEDDIKLPIYNWNVSSMKYNIDDLIKRRLGAVRDGLRIKWTIEEGIYEFDIFQKKLFRVEK